MLGTSSLHGPNITITSDYTALWDIYHRLYVQDR